MRKLLATLLIFSLATYAESQPEEDNVFDDLLDIPVYQTASLTPISERHTPAGTMIITDEMIKKSGARKLEDVLEIFVPNFQVMRHGPVGNVKGFRGLLSDLDHQILLLVNGKVMNHRAFYGAESEFFMSMLGDIKKIEVIRGPGSAVFGPGAIAGVIHIHTHSGKNFKGQELSIRQGFAEEFTNLEYKLGFDINKENSLFLYYGLDDYRGSEGKDSPVAFGDAKDGKDPYDYFSDGLNRNYQSYKGRLRHKAHLQLDNDNLTSWLRYVDNGQQGINERSDLFVVHNIGIRQFTFHNQYKNNLSNTLHYTLDFGYDYYKRTRNTSDPLESNIHITEQEFLIKPVLNWEINQYHQIAFGLEYSFERFNPKTSSPANEFDPSNNGNKDWTSYALGFFGEHQWQVNQDWTFISGFRIDKHSFAPYSFSPKLAAIYTPTEKDSFKLLYNRSTRRTDDGFLRREYVETGLKTDNLETVDNFELRYEKKVNDSLKFALSTFYSELDAIGFSGAGFVNQVLGRQSVYGAEFELSYKQDKHHVIFSHGFTKLEDFKLDQDVSFNVISAAPDGYGNDLAHWSNHITKLYYDYSYNEKISINTSIVAYWAYPGAEDFAEFNNNELMNDRFTSGSINGSAYRESIFLNSGAQYKYNSNTTFNLHLHNVLGWFDRTYNKRNAFLRSDLYRVDAPSISLSVDYKF